MHILLIHQAFAALHEPGGTRHHELARYLAGQGHRVTVIASPVSYLTGAAAPNNPAVSPPPPQVGLEESAAAGEVRILRSYTYAALHKSFVHRVFSFFSFMGSSFVAGLRVQEVDLVWGTSPPIFQGATAWLLARLKRAPFLFEVRDLWPAFAVQVGVLTHPGLIRLSQWLERCLYRRADRVVVNSPGFIEHVTQRGAREAVLVPNGADASMFDPLSDGTAFREAHGLQEKFIALYAGAHGMSNDLGVVLKAARLLEDDPRIALVLLGDGKEKPRLQAQAARMHLRNIHFLDSIPKTGMPGALAAADLCIGILKPIPLYGTVYPNKIFDYMAAGRPVALAMEGVIRQVIEQAGAGVHVPPGDAPALARAIREMAGAPETRRRMGQAGRAYVLAHFDRPVIAAQFEQVCQQLLQHTSSRNIPQSPVV